MAQVELASGVTLVGLATDGDHFWLVHTPAALKIFVIARDEEMAIDTAQAHFEERHWKAEAVEFEAEELGIPHQHLSGVVYAVWEGGKDETDLDIAEREQDDWGFQEDWLEPDA